MEIGPSGHRSQRLIEEGRLKPDQFERLVRFLRWHHPPSSTDQVDAIMIPTDSPNIDPTSFNMRIIQSVQFSKQYPNARVIFSGKRPDASRANEEEMREDYSEAQVMADKAIALGLDESRKVLEERSTHTGQSVPFVLDLLDLSQTGSLLVATSSYMARRIDYYLKKQLKNRGLTGSLKTFIFDGDVAEDIQNDSPLDLQGRKRERVIYESQRLFRYRRQGDL